MVSRCRDTGSPMGRHERSSLVFAAGQGTVESRHRATGKARCARSRPMLDTKIAGSAASESPEDTDSDPDNGGFVPRALRPLHCEIPGAGGGSSSLYKAWRYWYSRQRPHGNAREEQHGDCRGHVPLAHQVAAGFAEKTK